MILVDTNVLVRAVQPNHADCSRAKEAVKAARLRGYVPCIVPQIIYEYWVVATRPVAENGLGISTADAASDVGQLLQQFRFFRDERAIFSRWQELVRQHNVQGKTGHDARIVAAMERHNVRYLLTFNIQHFRRFSNISVIHPHDANGLPPW
jgi:predicted nucleic acid-binding protein